MTNQLKVISYLFILVSLLFSHNIALALDECGPELIWQIGDNEAPPDYIDEPFDEFDCDRPFNSDYYVHRDPSSKFPHKLDTWEVTHVDIQYNLTYEQGNKNLRLFVDTLYATHNSEMGEKCHRNNKSS